MLEEGKLVAFVALTDAVRACAFYRDLLGLRLLTEDDFALVFDVAGTMLRATLVPAFTPAPYTVLAWDVKDIAATVELMAQQGISCERFPGLPQDESGVWAAPSGAKISPGSKTRMGTCSA